MSTVVAIAFVLTAGAAGFLLWRNARQQLFIQELQCRVSDSAQRLAAAEQRQNLMFASNPYPMWVYDCTTLRFLEVNAAALQTYGYSREEFLGMTLLDIRPADDLSAFRRVADERHDGYSSAGVWRHRRKDGSILFVQIMAFEFAKNDRPQELILALDITERHRMEEALRASQASLQSLVDNAPFGIAQSLVAEGRVVRMNPAMRELLGGYTLEELNHLDIAEHLYWDPKERSRVMEVLRRNGRVEGWETSLRKRDGTAVPVRISGRLSGGDGTPEIFSPYVEDLTQQSTLEQQVRQVQKLEAVGRLAGGMAHDFNNVLVVIKLSTELMLGQIAPDNKFSKPLLQISNAADRAAALTRQMLAFGRQQIMQVRILNLNSVVSETTQMLRQVIGEDIHLVTTLADDVENSRLDSDQLTQVILNLAVNARDAMPAGGTLHLETRNVTLDEAYTKEHPPVKPGRYVMLAVSDTGTGIDKTILPRIFDPFFTTKDLGKGTGLGLSIVYGIVKQSGGYIWVYSEPDQGTTFKLYFPATSAAQEHAGARSEVPTSPSGRAILLVEDEDTIRSNVSDCLQQLGYRVYQAESGARALEVCAELHGKIDLVLTDLVMPEMSGHEMARALVKLYPQVRVLFMSGYTEDSAVRREILVKGSSFLQKPFSVAELANSVHQAILVSFTAI